MGRILLDINVTNKFDLEMVKATALPAEEVRQIRLAGVVDTGANHLLLPSSVIEALGVPKVGEASVRYGDHSVQIREIYEQIEVEILGRKATFRAIAEPNRDTALIGAIVLEELDFIADCGNQRLYPRDPLRIVAEVGVREALSEQ